MNEQDEVLLRDILDAARRALGFVDGKTRDALDADNYLIGFAVVRAIEIIGEAASKLTAETRLRYAGVEWRNVMGMRNRIVHDYTNVDYDIVWYTVQENLPELAGYLESILPPETDSDPD